MATTDMNDLPIGTAVIIAAKGVWGQGTHGTIARSYTIRFGHRMYDIVTSFGHTFSYYAPSQIILDKPTFEIADPTA